MTKPSYDDAVHSIGDMIDAERGIVGDLGATRLLTHRQPVENAIVLLHGFTNCPQQFAALGEQFYQRGYNVFIPRLPHHGLADRMTRDLKHLSAQELLKYVDETVERARGLGNHLAIAGLSLGGLLAAWAGQRCAAIDVAMAIAPDFGLALIPRLLERPAIVVLRALPDFYIWWDPRTKAENPNSYPFAYPGFSSRSVAEAVHLARIVRGEISGKPAAKRIVLVSIGGDPAVSNAEIRRMARKWQGYAPGAVTTYEFPQTLHLPHDIITPESPGTRVDIVYPKVIELIEGSSPAPARE